MTAILADRTFWQNLGDPPTAVATLSKPLSRDLVTGGLAQEFVGKTFFSGGVWTSLLLLLNISQVAKLVGSLLILR